MNKTRKVVAGGLVTLALSVATAPAALAAAAPPTNAGNGGGQSGQCTGPVTERPASCQASK
jgi:hypothetical protein